jgi:hypothetical protein
MRFILKRLSCRRGSAVACLRLAAFALVAVASAFAPAAAQAAFGPVGGDFRISFMGPDGSTSYTATEESVAYNPSANEYLVVWVGDDNTAPLVDNEFEVFAQRVSASGASLGGRIRVSDMGPDGNANYDAGSPSVAYNPAANEYLVAWQGDDNSAPLVDNETEIFGQRLTAAGVEAGANDFRVSDMGPDGDANYDAEFPSVAYSTATNEYLVAWEGDDDTAPLVDDEHEIFGQRLTPAGVEAGANDFRISDMGPNGDTTYEASKPSVAYSSAANEYLVIWQGEDDSAPLVVNEHEIFGQRLTAAGAAAGANDFRISDMGPDGNTAYNASDARVAYNSAANEYLVAWAGDDDTASLVDSEYEIFGQRLTAAGAEAGANDFRISEMGPDGDTAYDALDPSVAYNSAANEYLVAWDGDDDSAPLVDDEFELFGRRVVGEPAPPSGGGTPSGGDTPGGDTQGGGSTDTAAPRFLSLTLSPTAFAAFGSGPSVRGARARGTRISYRLSEAATATFRVQRALPGRRVRGRCVRPTRVNRGKPSCTRYRRLRGSFRHTGTAGLNRIRFGGRLAGRKLRPVNYRLVAVAEDAAGNRSAPVRRPFRIIR